jgi:hypothetical protein
METPMGYNFQGYRRLTFSYVSGWSRLDEHEYVGEFRLLNSRHRSPTSKNEEYGEAGTYFMTVRAPRGASHDAISAALRVEFSGGCRCERDCCGHVQHSAGKPIHKKRRNWVVPVRAYLNI